MRNLVVLIGLFFAASSAHAGGLTVECVASRGAKTLPGGAVIGYRIVLDQGSRSALVINHVFGSTSGAPFTIRQNQVLIGALAGNPELGPALILDLNSLKLEERQRSSGICSTGGCPMPEILPSFFYDCERVQ